jgi:ParB family chromosome partitioning protein
VTTQQTIAGVLEHLDPNEIEVETNVRTEASLTKQFIASIKEQGVLVPVVAVREDGKVKVRAGQRRTLAAREAGLTSIPVYIADADLDTATRLSQQIVENDHRLALSSVDRVKGIQQLLDTGLSVTKVAKRLSVSPDRVKQSKAVGESETAMSALHAGTVTLGEAAALAEFEGDQRATDRLMQAVGRSYFEHEVERLRQDRQAEADREEAAGPWREQGYTVVRRSEAASMDAMPLHALLTAEGEPADESAIKNPANWAITLSDEAVFTDSDGNPVNESLIDWSTEDDPEAEAEEGMLHCDSVVEKVMWVPDSYYCINPEAEGLTVSNWYKTTGTSPTPDLTSPTPDLTSEDLERKAAEKAERRRVIVLNKAGDAAQTVRRKFVTELLQRKTPPKGTAPFIAERLIADPYLLQRGGDVAGELLGADIRSGELLDHVSDARAEVVLLGVTMGSLELATTRDKWRNPDSESAAYLRFLAANGYGLSPVEQVIVGEKSAADCYGELS